MAVNRIATILKVIAWPIVVLLLATVFMLLFRSSIEQFISRWESFKMGDVEVKVETEQDKKFLENLLAEKDAYIKNIRQNIDSLENIVHLLHHENEHLATKLADASKRLPLSQKRAATNLVAQSKKMAKSSSELAKDIGSSANTQYQNLQVISKSSNFKQAREEVNKGFQLVLEGKFEEAMQAFQVSEKLYPSIQKKEKPLSDCLQGSVPTLKSDDILAKKRIYASMLRAYADKMRPEIKKKYEELLQS